MHTIQFHTVDTLPCRPTLPRFHTGTIRHNSQVSYTIRQINWPVFGQTPSDTPTRRFHTQSDIPTRRFHTDTIIPTPHFQTNTTRPTSNFRQTSAPSFSDEHYSTFSPIFFFFPRQTLSNFPIFRQNTATPTHHFSDEHYQTYLPFSDKHHQTSFPFSDKHYQTYFPFFRQTLPDLLTIFHCDN